MDEEKYSSRFPVIVQVERRNGQFAVSFDVQVQGANVSPTNFIVVELTEFVTVDNSNKSADSGHNCCGISAAKIIIVMISTGSILLDLIKMIAFSDAIAECKVNHVKHLGRELFEKTVSLLSNFKATKVLMDGSLSNGEPRCAQIKMRMAGSGKFIHRNRFQRRNILLLC